MDNLGYMFAAYIAIWLVIFLYLFFINRKQRRLQGEFEQLKRIVEKSRGK